MNYELDEKEKKDLADIQEYFERAEHIFSKLDRSLQDEILAQHAEEYSVNHALRWGLQAIEEINAKLQPDEAYFCPVCKMPSKLVDSCDTRGCEER